MAKEMMLGSSSSSLLRESSLFHRKKVDLAALTARSCQAASVRPAAKLVLAALASERIAETPSAAAVAAAAEKAAAEFTVRTFVTVKRKKKEDLKEKIGRQIDAVYDKIGQNVVLELVSTEIDPKTGKGRTSKKTALKEWFEKKDSKSEMVVYTAEFSVESGFGDLGAITVVNGHRREFYMESIAVEGFAAGPVHFTCNSWIQPSQIHPAKRIFFTNKPYLPSETPPGLRELREKELRELRGLGGATAVAGVGGGGERKLTDRVYDYAKYNDLGNPDKGHVFARRTLGGDEVPYPRRCRTGRPPTDTDDEAESRVEDPNPMYVPRDEAFSEAKQEMLVEGAKKAVLHNLVPAIAAGILPELHDFRHFHQIDNLFKVGLRWRQGLDHHIFSKIPLFSIFHNAHAALRFDDPHILTKDKFAWLRDDEFARQTLAGINPVSIERVLSFPPRSNLDPKLYGPPESEMKEEHIAGHLGGMSVEAAITAKKLFILDYHDAYMPFLDRINAQDGRKAYATRTLFFLTDLGTLKPVAIELRLPPESCGGGGARERRVFTPPSDATSAWLWQLAKAHVCANDAGVHQLVNHWLRTHACVEPFILSAHRHLSVMHPVMKLLKPHMKNTLEINALARQILINGGGVIESGFTPGSCSMEISAAAYRRHWRFDLEGLPDDLIRRGMAEEDPSQPHGLRLVIDDYPYAADGLLLWSAIKNWVRFYVNRYYPDRASVESDRELLAWYHEAVHVGHADICHASWWPHIDGPDDVASILTTLTWLTSAQHAALNFGQYPLGGFVPNRPPLMRRFVPVEGDPEFDHFRSDPHRFFLSAMPGLLQTTQFMTVVDTLSTHSADEEYLGERSMPYTWTGDQEAVEAFHDFAAEVRRAEEEIGRRNADPQRRNRCGAGVLPYELLVPSSGPGITCRGVPNSVSI